MWITPYLQLLAAYIIMLNTCMYLCHVSAFSGKYPWCRNDTYTCYTKLTCPACSTCIAVFLLRCTAFLPFKMITGSVVLQASSYFGLTVVSHVLYTCMHSYWSCLRTLLFVYTGSSNDSGKVHSIKLNPYPPRIGHRYHIYINCSFSKTN